MKRAAISLTLVVALLAVMLPGAFVNLASANFKTTPYPEVTAVSPAQNGVYNLPTIPLSIKVTMFRFDPTLAYEGLAWLNYSLDGQPEVAANITSQGPTSSPDSGNIEIANGVLSGLSDGQHTLYVRGNTTFAKYQNIPETSFTKTIYFTIDTVHPSLKVSSPQATATYTSANVTLNYNVNEEISWAGYKLDGGDFVTSRINTTLTNLSYRTHVIQVYANDSAGNQCYSPTIVFTVKDVDPPTITVLSAASTYNATEVPLNFAVNEDVSWIRYSLDDQANVTVSGNTTLAGLSSGSHTLRVFANDTAGNIGTQTIDFLVADAEPQQSQLFPTASFAIASVLVVALVSGGLLVYTKKCKRQAKPVS